MTDIEESLKEAEDHMNEAKKSQKVGEWLDALCWQNLALYKQNKIIIEYLNRMNLNTIK